MSPLIWPADSPAAAKLAPAPAIAAVAVGSTLPDAVPLEVAPDDAPPGGNVPAPGASSVHSSRGYSGPNPGGTLRTTRSEPMSGDSIPPGGEIFSASIAFARVVAETSFARTLRASSSVGEDVTANAALRVGGAAAAVAAALGAEPGAVVAVGDDAVCTGKLGGIMPAGELMRVTAPAKEPSPSPSGFMIALTIDSANARFSAVSAFSLASS